MLDAPVYALDEGKPPSEPAGTAQAGTAVVDPRRDKHDVKQ